MSRNIIQLLTIEALDMMQCRIDNTNIDRGRASTVNTRLLCTFSEQKKQQQQQQPNLGHG